MAEHGIDGPAIGIAYDGAGYGMDGTMWGGEVLVATPASFRRTATFRALPLVGGDRAVREPWRLAVALVEDAFGGAWPSSVCTLLADVPASLLGGARTLLGHHTGLPLARGVGRYFDAFGALFLRRGRAAFEGQIALAWNEAADSDVARVYPFSIERLADYDEVDLRPATRAAIADHESGEPIAAIAAAFHNTVAAATAEIVRRTIQRVGALPIVASGGCFQNARLAESVCAALAPEHKVWLQTSVPPGDGGIALGQAVIADGGRERGTVTRTFVVRGSTFDVQVRRSSFGVRQSARRTEP